jgi:DNA modification methylase
MSQTNLNLSTKTTGPVECLGQTFSSDGARREHYLKLLAEKLKDPDFRKIEGFPVGKDEDILALSDPPYYTACPNPWLGEFIKCYGTPYDPKVPYHREPFAADVSEGKNDPLYNVHSYHTKVPHKAILRYLLHYTEPGDVILDCVCGTGMTGVASQFAGILNSAEKQEFKTAAENTLKFGERRFLISDLSPAATSIAYGYNAMFAVDEQTFTDAVKEILAEAKKELGFLYETQVEKGVTAEIDYIIWSDVFICSSCSAEIVFWDAAVDEKAGQINSSFKCPHCGAQVKKDGLEHARTKDFDPALGQITERNKQIPVKIAYSVGRHSGSKRPDKNDLQLLQTLAKTQKRRWYPVNRMMNLSGPLGKWGDKWRAGTSNFQYIHELYTRRNLEILSFLWERISEFPNVAIQSALRFVFTATCMRHSLMNTFRFNVSFPSNVTLGTLYIASLAKETNFLHQFENKALRRVRPFLAKKNRAEGMVSTQSATTLPNIPTNSVDYVFIDPPFGDNFAYAELNFSWEAWLRVFTEQKPEAIVSNVQQKNLSSYQNLMLAVFKECYRILKPGRWVTIEFSNTKASVWNSIQTAMQEAGFVVANVAALDKQSGSFNAVMTTTAVKQDLVISAYKPNGGLEERFAKRGETEEGAWDFVRTHLKNLPVVKAKGGQMELIAERDPRILYDRMVAFYVGHSTPVPLSSAEFQAGLAEKFPERDGMFFLPEQVNEYDKKRAQVENIGQLSIFVEDERSAINWLRNFLKDRPSTYQDIQPEFMQQLSASWKRWEVRPELRSLLDQNFLCYDGTGEVPSQIHSYISTQFKELRNLLKDHPQLKAKARDRWYVPDPKKNVDVETLRNKRLLEEFWTYLPEGYTPPALTANKGQTLPGLTIPRPKIPKGKKLKEIRTEAVRVGFKHCYQQKDYQTILVVAEMVPESVLNEDEQLQMIYDTAVTRTGGVD